jgi:hypothetical protein
MAFTAKGAKGAKKINPGGLRELRGSKDKQ